MERSSHRQDVVLESVCVTRQAPCAVLCYQLTMWRNQMCNLPSNALCSRTINLRSTDTTVGGARAWAVLLAKTSRTAVPTAIMPIIAGGRLYKCLYKMHVDSRAFWGAFWGAFRVFLIDMG